MWLEFRSIDKETRRSQKTGKEYSCYVLRGNKLGTERFPGGPYERTVFDNTAVTVIEDGKELNNTSLVQFFQKGVKSGDIVTMTFAQSVNKEILTVERGKVSKNGSFDMPNDYIPSDQRFVGEGDSISSVPNQAMASEDELPWA